MFPTVGALAYLIHRVEIISYRACCHITQVLLKNIEESLQKSKDKDQVHCCALSPRRSALKRGKRTLPSHRTCDTNVPVGYVAARRRSFGRIDVQDRIDSTRGVLIKCIVQGIYMLKRIRGARCTERGLDQWSPVLKPVSYMRRELGRDHITLRHLV